MQIGMSEIDRKLRQVRKRLGLKQGELAEAIGVTQGTISRWETGTQEPDFKAMMKIADLANLDPFYFISGDEHPFGTSGLLDGNKIVGSIAHDVWVEGTEWSEQEQFEVKLPIPEDWKDLELAGYLIKDGSAEPRYSEGSVVFAVLRKPGILPKHDDVVIVAREDDRGLFEITLKEYYVNHRGTVYLSSVSADPEFYSAFKLASDPPDNTLESAPVVPSTAIVGIVAASFRLEHRERFQTRKGERKMPPMPPKRDIP